MRGNPDPTIGVGESKVISLLGHGQKGCGISPSPFSYNNRVFTLYNVYFFVTLKSLVCHLFFSALRSLEISMEVPSLYTMVMT